MGKPTKILLIDDNHTTNFLNRMVIERSTIATEVLAFENPIEALTYLEHVKNEMVNWLIFLDINMPEMDGWQFADQYQQLSISESNKLVMLTSSVDPRDEDRANAHSTINAYRTKPLSFDVLTDLGEKYFT